MLVNGDHAFTAKDEFGAKALQVIGSWDESAVSDLAETVDQHRSIEATRSTASHVRMTYGEEQEDQSWRRKLTAENRSPAYAT